MLKFTQSPTPLSDYPDDFILWLHMEYSEADVLKKPNLYLFVPDIDSETLSIYRNRNCIFIWKDTPFFLGMMTKNNEFFVYNQVARLGFNSQPVENISRFEVRSKPEYRYTLCFKDGTSTGDYVIQASL